MTNHQLNSATNAYRSPSRSATPILMAASIVVGISGGCLVPFNPALARMPDSTPLATGVTPGLVTDGVSLSAPASLRLVSSLAISDLQVQRSIPTDPIRTFFRQIFRFFFGFIPVDPV